jgi:iron complex outermembrane receptor protein
MIFRSPLILSCGLAALIPLCAEDALQLSQLHVTARQDAALTAPPPEQARALLGLTPGGVETIDAERFLRGRASTLEDTFALSPGVVAQARFGSDEARLSIRGSGLQRTFHGRGLRVLQDGVPINLADGSFDMQSLEPLSAAYVNVWRGGNALAYGASTLGGAIDYRSRTGRDTTPLLARTEAGAWNYLRTSVAGGGVRGDFDAYGSFTHQSQDGFRDHARQNNQRLFANSGVRWSPSAETRVYLTAVHTASELPGNLTQTQLETNPRQAAAGNVALHQKRDFDLLRLAAKTTLQRNATVWDFTAAWTYKDLDHPIFQVIDQLTNDLMLGAGFTHLHAPAGRQHRWRAGLLFTHGTIRAANFLNLAGRRGALASAATQTALNLELYAEDQIDLGRGLTLVAGIAASANRRDHDQTFGATPDYALDYESILPKLGLRWDGRDLQVFANVSGSHEPPSFSETFTVDTAREAQSAVTVEVGTRGRRGPVRWDATLYHAAVEKELLTIDHDHNPATPAATINAGDTVHAGFEFATEIDLLGTPWNTPATPRHRLVLRAAWTYGRFRFKDDPLYGNNTLAGLSPHLVRGEIAWEQADGWYAGPTFEWVPRRVFIDFRNTSAADAYALAGFRLGRRLPQGLSWFVELRNAFDIKYAATTGVIENAGSADQPQFLPGDGRGVFGGIEYRW